MSATSDVATFSPFHLPRKPAPKLKLKQLQLKNKDPPKNSPESVAYSVLEVDKVVPVDAEQIASVEVQIAFFQDVAEPLLLRLLLVSGVPNKRRPIRNFSHQESRLT